MITFLRLLKNDLRQLRWYVLITSALITAFAAEAAIVGASDAMPSIEAVVIYSFICAAVVAVVFACVIGYSDLGNKRRSFLLSKPVSSRAVIISKYLSGLLGLFLMGLGPIILFFILALVKGELSDFFVFEILSQRTGNQDELAFIASLWGLAFVGIYSLSFLFTVLWRQPFYAGLFGLFVTALIGLLPFILPVPIELLLGYRMWLVLILIIILVSVWLSIYTTRKQWAMGIGFKGMLWTVAVTVAVISVFLGREIGHLKPVDIVEFSDINNELLTDNENRLFLSPEVIPVNVDTDGKINFPDKKPGNLTMEELQKNILDYLNQRKVDRAVSSDYYDYVDRPFSFVNKSEVFYLRTADVFKKKADAPEREADELNRNGINNEDYEFDKYILEITNSGSICSQLDLTDYIPEKNYPRNPRYSFNDRFALDKDSGKFNILFPGYVLLVIDINDPFEAKVSESHKLPFKRITLNESDILPLEYLSGIERVRMTLELRENYIDGYRWNSINYIENNECFTIAYEKDKWGFSILTKRKVTEYNSDYFKTEIVDKKRDSLFEKMLEGIEYNIDFSYSDGYMYEIIVYESNIRLTAYNVKGNKLSEMGYFVFPPNEIFLSMVPCDSGYIAVMTRQNTYKQDDDGKPFLAKTLTTIYTFNGDNSVWLGQD